MTGRDPAVDAAPEWKDAEGNTDWDAYAQESIERQEAKQAHLPLGRSWFIEDVLCCGTCDGGGCGDCVE